MNNQLLNHTHTFPCWRKERLKMLKHGQVNDNGIISNHIRESLPSNLCECLPTFKSEYIL